MTDPPVTDNDERRLLDAVDYIEIRRLQDAYADIVTRRQWHELAEVFLPTTTLDLDLRERTINLVGPQAIGEFIATAVDQFEFFQFGVLGSRVQLRVGGVADIAMARMYMTELRQTPQGHWSQIYGVYHDRFERVDGEWWFAGRTYHSLARNNLPAAVFEFPHHLRLDSID